MKKVLAVILVLCIAFTCFANAASEQKTSKEQTPVQAALEKAKSMGWDELLAKAKEEIGDNEFSIYAISTRLDVDTFTQKTGIKTKTTVLGSSDLYTKFETEAEAGVYGADILVATSGYNMGEVLEAGYIENYVPDAYKNILPADEQTPLNVQYYNIVFFYNNGHGELKNYITNMWQIGDPEYGNVIMSNPVAAGMTSWVIEMTKPEWEAKIKDAYKSYYGKEWQPSEKFPYATYEWIYRLIQNSVFEAKGGTIYNNTINGRPGTIGMVAFSKWRSGDIDTLTVCSVEGIEGVGGLLAKTYLTVAANAKYPYTAALFINYLLSEEGYAAYYGKDPGGYSSNPQIVPSETAKERGDISITFWKDTCPTEDPEYISKMYYEVYPLLSQWVAEKK